MKKTLLKILVVILLIPILWVGYNKLPIEITRHSDIRLGNELVSKIRNFQSMHDRLPEPDSSQVLLDLGFKRGFLDVEPAYQKINDSEFEIIYLEGFDGPYLLYNSKIDKWKEDFPTIPDRWKEKN
nr:hypothetical protein [uncultured Draconibacterium sp.]